MGNLTPAHYSKLIRRSGLPPTVRLVALTIAALRFDEQLTSKPHQPLEVTRERLAADCNLSLASVRRALRVLVDAGWLRTEAVYRDGRQRASRFWLLDAELEPSTTTAEGHSDPQYRGSNRTLSRGSQRPTVLRSKNRVAADDAALRGGGGSDGTAQTQTARGRSDSALGGADLPAGEQVHAEAVEVVDAELARHQAERRDAASGVTELAAEPFRPNPFAPTNFVCPSCNARPGHTCRRPKPGTAFGTEPRPQPHDQRVAAAAAAARHRLAVVPS